MQAADIHSCVARLRKISRLRPTLGIVLGSGFQSAVSRLRVSTEIDYAKLPGFPRPSVGGHAGKLILGHFGENPVLVLSGRAHYYEGHKMEVVTFPIRVLAEFGIRDLLLTNAAGGINRRLRAGDFMLLSDHINFMPANPLRGDLTEGCTRFVDLTRVYDARLSDLIIKAARKIALPLQKGVYLAVPGPCYETPAEIRAFARLGADAVGMSTVPEAIVARQCGVAVAGLSCVTNLAAGLGKRGISHAEVLAMGQRVGKTARDLIYEFTRIYKTRRFTDKSAT